jgi:lysophospholipase L1-like esterase
MRTRRIAIAITLALLFAISLLGNVVLHSQWRKAMAEHAAVRLDPLGLSFFPVGADSTIAPSEHRVVFFGDSRAQNWPAPTGLSRLQFINRGIGHQTTAQVLERFDRHVGALHPHIIVLEAGVNDLTKINFFPERREKIVDDCKKNIHAVVERARAADAKVVLVTVFPLGRVPLVRRAFWSSDVAKAVAEVNTYVRSLAKDGVVVLESELLLPDANGETRADLSFDFMHLNAAGYDALNAALRPLLEKLD